MNLFEQDALALTQAKGVQDFGDRGSWRARNGTAGPI